MEKWTRIYQEEKHDLKDLVVLIINSSKVRAKTNILNVNE